MSETVFKQVNYDLNALVKFVELGQIGLPDIQRPFVWKNAKVRNLFDSMYRGYPVGYLLFWENALLDGVKTIGIDQKQAVPNFLIPTHRHIGDGQQRLTSLFAVVKGIPVIRESYEAEQIEIAFNPLEGKFEVPELSKRFSSKEMEQMRYWHALPEGWEVMDYGEFLKKRREMMAKVISDAYELLAKDGPAKIADLVSIADLVAKGEGTSIEFKGTLRTNLHTGEKDPRMEMGILKTIAAFLNSHGGTLVVGVMDDGNPVGIEADKFENDDKMLLHLDNLIKERIGHQHSLNIQPRFDDYQGKKVLVIECKPGKAPVFVKDGSIERFFVRGGASTTDLSGSQTQEFIKQRFI